MQYFCLRIPFHKVEHDEELYVTHELGKDWHK